MITISHRIARSKPLPSTEIIRRRLAALAYAAVTVKPSVMGSAVLPTEWRRLDYVHIHFPELAALHDQVDRLLGGRLIGGGR